MAASPVSGPLAPADASRVSEPTPTPARPSARPGDILRIRGDWTMWRVVEVDGDEAVVESVTTGLRVTTLASTLCVVEPHPGGAR